MIIFYVGIALSDLHVDVFGREFSYYSFTVFALLRSNTNSYIQVSMSPIGMFDSLQLFQGKDSSVYPACIKFCFLMIFWSFLSKIFYVMWITTRPLPSHLVVALNLINHHASGSILESEKWILRTFLWEAIYIQFLSCYCYLFQCFYFPTY